MADEPTVPLKEYVDTRFAAVENAVEVANEANEKRLDSVNEFRATLTAQQATFVTKDQVRWAFGSLLVGLGVATAIFAAIKGVG